MSQVLFCGPTYQGRSVNINSNRSINLYPELTGTDSDKASIVLVGTPGCKLAWTAPVSSGEVRGVYVYDDKVFVVVGNKLYSLSTSLAYTELQTLNTSTGRVSIADNGISSDGVGGDQLMLVDGTDGWIYDRGTGLVSQITDADFMGSPTHVVYADGYFVVIDNSMNFIVSELYDGMAYNALATAAVSSLPDSIQGIAAHNQQVYFIKEYSTEVWYNAGVATTVGSPFLRQPGAVYDYGTSAPWSVARVGNSIYFLATTRSNETATFMGVVEIQAYQPVVISPPNIAYIISTSTILSDCFAYCYGADGHLFYVLTKPHTAVTFTASTDVVNLNAHGRKTGDIIQFATVTTTTGLSTGTDYYVINPTRNTFQVSATFGGSAVALTNDGTGTLEDSWTLVYDTTTKLWHEWSSFDLGGTSKRHLSSCYAYYGNKHYVGDYRQPLLYELSSEYYSDGGVPIYSIRTSPHIFDKDELGPVFVSRFDLDIETGKAGETTQTETAAYKADGVYKAEGVIPAGSLVVDTTEPYAYLSWSNDGGNTWSSEYGVSMGTIGSYSTRCVWRRLGQSRNRVFKLRISSLTAKNIIGAYVRTGL